MFPWFLIQQGTCKQKPAFMHRFPLLDFAPWMRKSAQAQKAFLCTVHVIWFLQTGGVYE